jgi:hypothetical protein
MFLTDLRNLTIPKGAKLFKADAISMYTNIDSDIGTGHLHDFIASCEYTCISHVLAAFVEGGLQGLFGGWPNAYRGVTKRLNASKHIHCPRPTLRGQYLSCRRIITTRVSFNTIMYFILRTPDTDRCNHEYVLPEDDQVSERSLQ